MEANRLKFQCSHPGCNHSYLRSEHLNRHTLIHKKGAHICFLCHRRFTRNDLLNAHLRRHEKRGRITEGAQPSNVSHLPNGSPPSIRRSSSQNIQSPEASPIHTRHGSMDTFVPSLDASYPNPSATTYVPQLADHTPSQHLTTFQTHSNPFYPHADGQEDFTWLFREASLFDLPPDDYLNLHFGGSLGNTPPDAQYPPLDQSFQHEANFTAADFQKLVIECPDLITSALNEPSKVIHVLRLALDYCDVYMPLFHRPTFDLTSRPTLLVLSLCGLGVFLGGGPASYETGKMLQKHVWRRSSEMALQSPRVELWILQTMVLVGHISTYALTRHEHEMAEIAHSMIVTLARRNSLLAESYRPENAPRQSIDEKWKEWAHRESVIRLAHTIFVNDVQSTIHFTHPATLSVGMMKLPLPSSPTLWAAPTAVQWESQMRQTKRSNRSKYYSLQSSVESLMSIRDPDLKREFLQRFNSSNPLALNILIHGITSAIGDDKYRTVASSSSPATRILKVTDFSEALIHWRACFDRMCENDKSSPLAWNSLLMSHFAAVLLRNNISDIQMAAGSAFSFGRVVTPQRAQGAYTRLVTTEPVSQESYLHGLEIVRLSLQGAGSYRSSSPPTLPTSPPLWQTYCAFLGTLVIWAYTVSLERLGRERVNSFTSVLQPLPPGASTMALPDVKADGPVARTLTGMFERVLGHSEFDVQELKAVKNDLALLINTVHGRMDDSSWDISHEARRILTSLKEREGSVVSQT